MKGSLVLSLASAVVLALPLPLGCKAEKAAVPAPDDAGLPVQQAVLVKAPDRPTIASTANRLGWQILSRLPAAEHRMLAPLSLARSILHRASAMGPEALAALAEGAFAGRDPLELMQAADALEPSFVKDARSNSMRLHIHAGPTSAMQSLITELNFEGHWHQRFEKDRTHPRPFVGASGASKERPFMVQSARLPHAETDNFTLVELPYQSERFSMLVWRPKSPVTLVELLMIIAESGGRLGVEALTVRPINLELPRFGWKEEVSLTKALEELGLGASLDFAQRLELVVDEDGADGEGARAPVVGARVIDRPPLGLVIDGPFAFAVRDRPSGAMILIGFVSAFD